MSDKFNTDCFKIQEILCHRVDFELDFDVFFNNNFSLHNRFQYSLNLLIRIID